MPKIVSLLTCTRPHMLNTSYGAALTHGDVILNYDSKGEGAAAIRNQLIEVAMKGGDDPLNTYIRFVDDDDVPLCPLGVRNDWNTDVVVTSFMSNDQLVKPDPTAEFDLLALNSVVSGNWFISLAGVAKVIGAYGRFYDPNWTRDLGFRIFKRFGVSDLSLKVLPDTVSYVHRRGLLPGSMTDSKPDPQLLLAAISDSESMGVVDGFMRVVFEDKVSSHAINTMHKFRRKTGRWPLWHHNPRAGFSDKMAWRVALDSRPLMQDLCDKRLSLEYAKRKEVPVLPYWVIKPEELDGYPFVQATTSIYKINRASGMNVRMPSWAPSQLAGDARSAIRRYLDTPFFRTSGEFGYIGEQYLIKQPLIDNVIEFNVYCFNGKAQYAQWRQPDVGARMIAKEMITSLAYQFRNLKVSVRTPPLLDSQVPNLEYKADEMWKHAERMTAGVDFVRVDFIVNKGTGEYYFNEFSPYSNGVGTEAVFESPRNYGVKLSADQWMGQWWQIDRSIDVPFHTCMNPNKIDEAFRG